MAIRSLPQQFMFVGKMVIIAGSDFPPRLWDGISAPAVIGNTFTALYPAWGAATTYLVDDLVIPTPANGHYYKAVQGGVSAGAMPVFPTGSGQRVTDNQIIWQEAGLVTGSPAPPGAAHGIVYAGALWIFNTFSTNTADGLDGPSALRMSDVNNPGSWNPLNAAFIGKDDGSQGMGLASFTIAESGIPPLGALVAFKEFSSYQVTGVFGSPNFSIQRIQTDMGCVAPRTIQFLPGFGIGRLSHLGPALYDGVRDRLFAEELRPYLFGGAPDILPLDWNRAYLARGGLIGNPPMYAILAYKQGDAAGMTRLFLFDLVLKAWTVLDLPTGYTSLSQVRQSGTVPITLLGAYDDGTICSIQQGGTRWNTYVTYAGDQATVHLGQRLSWSFRTPDVFDPSSPSRRVYFRSIIIRGSSTVNGDVGCTVYYQGEDGLVYSRAATPASIPVNTLMSPYPINYLSPLSATTSRQFEVQFDLGESAINAYAVISGSDYVEIESVEWFGTPLPGNVPARFGR